MFKKALNKKLNSIKNKTISIAKWCWATLPRKIISCLVIAGILLSSIWLLLLKPKPVEAAWWDEDWLYRQPVSISAHSVAETDVYIIIPDVDTSDTSKFQDDCGDLRFTKYNGELLDYYIDSGSRGGDIVVHVLFDTFPAGAQTIYYYFGNPSADNGFKTSGFSVLASSYTVDEINTGLEEKGTGPVLWLRFDEGYGTTAFDSSEQGNDGTITDATWTDYGKFGKALDFDTPGDLVTVTQNASINLSGKDGYSISAWIYPHSDGGSDVGEIIDKGTNNYFRVDSEGADGYLDIEGKLDLADTDANLNVADAIRVNRWSHILLTYEDDDDDEITIYVNGVNMGSSDNGIGSLADDSGDNLLIGGDANATFDGIIDEVKIYPYARDAAQIKRNYNQGAAARIGRDDSWLTEGLVGYWKMDEASWDGSANEVEDSSGAGNHGVRVDGADTGAGKFGRGGIFDGDGDYVDVPSSSSLEFNGNLTVSFWARFDSVATNMRLIHKRDLGGTQFDTNLGSTDKLVWYDGTYLIATTASQITTMDVWYHIVYSTNGTLAVYVNGINQALNGTTTAMTSNDADLHIGADFNGGSGFNGAIDDVRIYNRALSDFEIRRLYDWGPPPVGEWKFDEYSGTTAYDTGENSNDGAITGAAWRGAADCKYGSCLEYDGTDDVSIISADSAIDLNLKGGYSVCGWINPDSDGEGDNGEWFSKGDSYVRVDTESGNTVELSAEFDLATSNATLNTTQTINTGSWSHICTTWQDDDDDELTIYINGISAGSSVDGSGAPTNDSGLDLYIGGDSSNNFDGQIDDVKIYDYALTQKQIIEVMLGGRPAITERTASVGSMVGYWKFDEGFGTTAYDASGRGNHLILSNDTESFAIAGKFGMAWDGDGTQYLSLADDPDFDFTAAENFSITGWFKSDSADNPGSNEYLVNKGPPSLAGYAVYIDTSGDVVFGIDDDDADGVFDDTAGNVGRDFYDAAWHHLAAIKTDTSSIAMFVDGIEISTDSAISGQGDLTNSAILYLGAQDGTDDGDEFNGDIDEVKIYRFALSPEEILLDYNKGKSVIMGAVGTESDGTTPSWSQTRAYCPPGFTGTCTPPVGEWKFDEYSGSTAYDTSANSNDGTLQDNTTWKSAADCKYGSCLEFDGDGDYVGCGNDTSLQTDSDLTAIVWVRPSVGALTDRYIYGKGPYNAADAAFVFYYQNSDTLKFSVADQYLMAGSIAQNEWTFLAISYKKDSWGKVYQNGEFLGNLSGYTASLGTSHNLVIGAKYNGALPFDGAIDDVKIFDYAMTQEQISWLYNKGKPVGYWKFDEGEGSTAKDSSENNNSGTITDATWTTSGKYNSGLNFDGAGDWVTFTEFPEIVADADYSLSWWMKLNNTPGTDDFIFAQYNASDDRFGITMQGTSLDFGHFNGTSYYAVRHNVALETGVWYFVVAINHSDTSKELYVNNVDDSVAGSGESSWLSGFFIGQKGDTTRNFDGIVDEVKIYNYALTEEQIKIDYNQGSALRFGN